jgi:ATP-dependent DNA helicase RecG
MKSIIAQIRIIKRIIFYPGRFPIGVTPQNILHKTVKRNEHLAKVFYDLKLMEREGSGYDKMYEILLSNGKQLPEPTEGDDRVSVTIRKHVIKTEIIRLVNRANEEFQLRQKEIICFGLIAQHGTLSAIEFSKVLNLPQANAIRDWMGRLLEFGLIDNRGKTKGVEYFIDKSILKKLNFKGKTSLKKIENHRLRELIMQDLAIYEPSSISEVWERIGTEIPYRKVKTQLYLMVFSGDLGTSGKLKSTKYFIDKKL